MASQPAGARPTRNQTQPEVRGPPTTEGLFHGRVPGGAAPPHRLTAACPHEVVVIRRRRHHGDLARVKAHMRKMEPARTDCLSILPVERVHDAVERGARRDSRIQRGICRDDRIRLLPVCARATTGISAAFAAITVSSAVCSAMTGSGAACAAKIAASFGSDMASIFPDRARTVMARATRQCRLGVAAAGAVPLVTGAADNHRRAAIVGLSQSFGAPVRAGVRR